MQEKEQARLKGPSDEEIRQAEKQNEVKMESFIRDMIENMPKSNGDSDTLDEIKNKFD